MKWQIWVKFAEDGSTETWECFEAEGAKLNGKPKADLATEDGEHLFYEFETCERVAPFLGYGPSESPLHGRAAFDQARAYMDGYEHGRTTPSRVCAVHANQVHGGEAEELRHGIEEILENYNDAVDTSDVINCMERLRKLLEDVDARDSLAHIEQEPPKTTMDELKERLGLTRGIKGRKR